MTTERRCATTHTWLDLLLVVLSGLLMWTAFPFWNFWPLTIVSLAILIGVIDRVRPVRATGYAALWTMAFLMPLISWMQVATDGTWLAWIALAGAQAFFVGLWGLSFSATQVWSWARSMTGETVVAGFLWVTFEQLRSRVPFSGFPWGNVSYPQVNGPLLGLAPIGGEILTSLVVVAVAVLLRRAAGPQPRGLVTSEDANQTNSGVLRRLAALGAGAVLFAAPSLLSLPKTQEAGEVSVALIQGNVEIPMDETFATPHKVTGNHARETLAMLEDDPDLDLIIWGENGTDLDPRTDKKTAQMVAAVVEESEVPLLFGLMEYEPDQRYNWMAVWDPKEGLLEEMYGKQQPVPWGEYVPMRQISEFLATAAAQVSVDMVAVDNPAYLEISLDDGRVLPIAIGICFEVAYEPIIAEGVALGGQMIVIPTNNAHFQNTAQSAQQLQMARFRAAEFSRSAVQVSTNGSSGVIRPDGSLVAVTGTQEAAHLVASLPLRNTLTPFTRVSAWLPWTVMSAGLAFSTGSLGAYLYARGVRRRRPGQPRR